MSRICRRVSYCPRWKKKPVVVYAQEVSRLLESARENWAALPEWFAGAYERGVVLLLNDAIEISTLEGTMRAEPGDFVIQGVKGELYPCRRDIFFETYDRVD